MGQFFDKGIVQEKALSGEPIEFNGLFLYPLMVKQYGLFLACESALTLRMSMLPAIYAAMNYGQAIFKMQLEQMLKQLPDQQETQDDLQNGYYWTKFFQLLVCALRIPPQAATESIKMAVDPENQTVLKALIITQITDEGEYVVRISPSQIGQLRELIAYMNGVDIPDEADNPELVQAEQDILALQNRSDLEVNLLDLKAAIARDQRIRMKDLDEWTILEFNLIKQAIERDKHFMVCGIGEASGMVKYKNGNPFPSPFFNRKHDSAAVISAQGFQQRIQGAVASVDSLPTNLPI